MPFVIADVDKHKKGLSDKAKEQWVAIANSVLERCKKEGGDACDTKAIMQASGAVEKGMTYDEALREYALKDRQTFNIAGVEIFSTGKWNGDDYKEKDLDDMILAFRDVGFKPPLKLGHDEKNKDGQPAIGWVDKIYRMGNKLLADFKELPIKVYEALKRGNYKQVSSEIFWNYPNNGKMFSRVLKAVALLGADVPAVTNLEGLENLYINNKEVKIYQMEKEFKEWDTAFINDLPDSAFAIIKSGGEKDEDGKTVPRALRMLPHHDNNDSIDKPHLRNALARLPQADLTAEQKQQALRHLQAHAKALEIGESAEMTELENKINLEVKEMEDLNKAKEKIIELENQIKDLTADKESKEKAFAEIKQKEKALSIKTFIDEQKKEGKIIPAIEKEIESLLMSANDEKVYKYSQDGKDIELTQSETLKRIVSNLPKIIEFSEMSKSAEGMTDGSYKSAGEEIDRLAKSYSEKNKISYSEAVKAILDKNPDLKAEYVKGGK